MGFEFSFFLSQLDAIKEEGLFRVASSTLKIKRLAALFDTGEASDFVINEITDPHVFSGECSPRFFKYLMPKLHKQISIFIYWLQVL